jgi:diguanylate cyclase (GGDEF)-like protein/PAS domain S-box-containing protein
VLNLSQSLASGAGLMGFAAAVYSISGVGSLFRPRLEIRRGTHRGTLDFVPEQHGLRELFPEDDYERLLAELEATPATPDADFDAGFDPNAVPARDDDQRLSHALSDAAMGMLILDREWKIQSANRGMEEITGYTAGELVGMPIVSLGDEAQREETIRGLRMVSEKVVSSYRSECRLIRKDRSPVWLRSCSSRVDARHDSNGDSQIVVLSENITAEVAARERLAWQAMHDTLTGLPNRARFEEALRSAIQNADPGDPEVALICLDLDGFKAVNTSMGRAAGDAILRQVADRLRESLEEPDLLTRGLLARISGDKFGVIVASNHEIVAASHKEDHGADNTEGPARLAERLLAAFAAPFQLRESEIVLSANAGISRYPADGQDPDVLLQSASAAMHDSKRAGPNTWCFCTPRLKNDVSERLLLGSHLGKALAEGEMCVEFQPQYEIPGNRLVGFEALCRWHSPVLGEVEPARFIPAAEESGLIVAIGQFVLREACLRAVGWQTGLTPVRVAVNVSAVQFGRTDFVDSVLAVVRETGLYPRLLELELTESSLVKDPEESARKMVELRAFGIRIAIDDFGTGYSSLSYLQHMPVDTLKVDRAFTARLGRNSTAVTMVRAIIAMGQALGLRVVTEGVETETQAEILRQLGSDEVQGDLYGRAETADAATERVWRELIPASRDRGMLRPPVVIEEARETVQ